MAQTATSCLKRLIDKCSNNWNTICSLYSQIISNISPASGAGTGHVSSGCPDASQGMELELLDKKLRRLVCKLRKHEIFLEVFDHNNIEYGAVLGRGGEAEVRKCTVIYNDVPVEAAVKTVLSSSEDAISITLDEIELLCLARDPIINTTLQVYGVAAVPDDDDPVMGHLVIVTEAGLMNTLQLYQQENVPLHITLNLWKRLSAALYTMHNRRIIHQDLKPENILVTAINRDRSGSLEKIDFKIIDLGMGKRVYTEKVVTDDVLGTNGYHAPEVLFECSYDFRADIFMLGITFCVLLHSPAFLKGKSNLSTLLKNIHLAKQKKKTGRALYDKVIATTLDDNQNIPTAIANMICQMLEKQDKRSISLLDVIKICDSQATNLIRRRQPTNILQVLQPCTNGQDSGISSEDCYSKASRPNRKKAAKRKTSSPSSSVVIISDSTKSGSSHTYNTRLSSGSITPVSSSRTTHKRKPMNRELDALFEPWMGEYYCMRRGRRTQHGTAKRPRSDPDEDSGRRLRKRTHSDL